MSTYGEPLTYSQWQNAWSDPNISEIDCLARASELVAGAVPSSLLGGQKYHRASSSFSSAGITGIDTSTIKAIGGNTFFDYLPGY